MHNTKLRENMTHQNKQLNKAVGFAPVIFALIGNSFIAIIKLIGFLISGSGALFSETIHSLVDTANQGLLIIGIKRSRKKADKDFSYGFGKERFVWALISACGIFFIGSGVTIYRGLTTLTAKKEVQISSLIFVILAISLIIELSTFLKAWKELKKDTKEKKLKEILIKGDPASLAVLFEDGAAVLGIMIAFTSIILTSFTGNYLWDPIGSIIIGILLGIVAVVLVNKNRELLIAKSMPEEIKTRVIRILEADPSIEKVLDFKSSILDTGCYRIKCEVEFNGSALLKETYKNGSIKNQYQLVRNSYEKFLKFCVDYTDRIPRLMGSKIDAIENKIQREIPGIRHIDIEIN